MMAALRFLMLFALAVWLGGIVFFGAVLAPTVFSVLPKRELAGAVVTRALALLHWIGLAAGLVFLAASLAHNYMKSGSAAPFAGRHLLVVAMLVLTLISQLGVAAKMQALRADMVEIDAVPHDDPAASSSTASTPGPPAWRAASCSSASRCCF